MLMSIMLVILLGISALVLDIGNARRVRRAAQGVGDSAALAAAKELGNTILDPAARITNAIAQVRAFVTRNMPTADSGWATCSDPNALAYVLSPSATGNCISFDSDTEPTKVRVKVPTVQVQSRFANHVGQSSVSVSAASTAAIASPPQLFEGRLILPIAHGPSTQTSWTRRIFRLRRSSPSPGYPLIYDDGNLSIWDKSCRQIDSSSTAACVVDSPRLTSFISETSGGAPDALKVNLAMGLDHELGTYPSNSRIEGPPTRVCDGGPIPPTSPCSTTNVGTGLIANHVITAQGRIWTWSCFLIIFCSWNAQDLPTMGAWRTAVDTGLALGDISLGGSAPPYFTLGSTKFCARLARPALTDTNYNVPQPGGSCTPDGPLLTLSCGWGCTRTVNGRHIARYLHSGLVGYFWGNPGGSNAGCSGDPVTPDPNPLIDNVSSAKYTQHPLFSSTVSGDTRLAWYLSASDASPFPCYNPPSAPIFDAAITRDPRFAWILVIQSDCNDSGTWWQTFWDWSFNNSNGTFNWNRDETKCGVLTPKYITELRAVFIDSVQMSGSRIDKVYAWEFDPALIDTWTSIGPSPIAPPIDYQGGPGVPILVG